MRKCIFLAIILALISTGIWYWRESTMREVIIYFSSENGRYMISQKKKIQKDNIVHQAKDVINLLIKGPPDNRKLKMFPTIPEGVKLLGVKIDSNRVDVNFSRALIQNHPGGSNAEIQTIFSIVNSLTHNFDQIKWVQILVEGEKVSTISGHLCISFPFREDVSLMQKEENDSKHK